MPRADDPLLDLDELASALRDNEGPAQPAARRSRTNGGGAGPPGPRRRLSLRWTVAVGAVALLAGTGLGVGVGSSVTPAGHAAAGPSGFGFLAAEGWTVVQSGTIGRERSARAIASNVSLHAGDDLRSAPHATLQSLPRRGIVIDATFTPRGDLAEDIDFPSRKLPLDVGAAQPAPTGLSAFTGHSLGEYRLRAGVGGYNVDAWIYYGTAAPSPASLAAAHEQLSRLVVASDEVTIFARPLIVPWDKSATIFGALSNGRQNEIIEIEVKECGNASFRGVTAARTREGGAWEGEVRPGITTDIRAVWKAIASKPVTIQQRVGVLLNQKERRLFRVSVGARAQFWRKRIVIQRRQGGSWRFLKSVVLDDQEGSGGFVWTSADFRVTVPKGTRIRAAFSSAQARPCLLGGVSNELRTFG